MSKETSQVDPADAFLGAAQGDDKDIIDSLSEGEEGEEGNEDAEDNEGEEGNEGNQGKEGNEVEEDLSEDVLAESKETVNEALIMFRDNPEDEETKTIKEDMLNLFEGGHSFDEEGNILDKDGNQIASYDDLVDKVGRQEDMLYDDAGNQVDSEGKIITTKFDLDLEKSEINSLGKELGYEFAGEDGKAKLYAEGNEGLKELTKDIVIYETNKQQEEFFNSNPILKSVAQHLLAGNDLKTFTEPVDYSKVDLSTLSLENKKNYVKQSYLVEGVSNERAERLSSSLVEGDELDTQTKEALQILNNKQEEREEAHATKIAEQQEQERQNNIKYWGEVETTITNGKLDDFNIPEKDKKEFFTYLAVPVQNGLSQDQLDRQKRTLGGNLKEAYYRFKGYDVTDAVNEGIKSASVKSIRQRIKKSKNLQTNRKPANKGGIGEISLDTIMP